MICRYVMYVIFRYGGTLVELLPSFPVDAEYFSRRFIGSVVDATEDEEDDRTMSFYFPRKYEGMPSLRRLWNSF